MPKFAVLCHSCGIKITVADTGIEGEPVPGALDRRIARSPQDFATGPAMTRRQAIQALNSGVALGQEVDCGVVSGETGIGTPHLHLPC